LKELQRRISIKSVIHTKLKKSKLIRKRLIIKQIMSR
jgi:hypothetical protein